MTFFQNPTRLLWLVSVCLLLLGLSQVLWINRVWKEQQESLQQETNYLFQQTVMTLQDSLVRRSMAKNGDPGAIELPRRGPIFEQRLRPLIPPSVQAERSIQFKKSWRSNAGPQSSTQVQIIVSASDTQPRVLERSLSRVLLHFRPDSLSQTSNDVVLEIQNDTVSQEELRMQYTSALQKAALPITFQLMVSIDLDSMPPPRPMTTEPALAGLLQHHFFQAAFYDYQGYLMRKITPYGLFSLFLFGLTSLAFWLIINNLRQQQRLALQKNEFISNVTHELKTPLTTVGVALEALHDFEVLGNPEKTREYLQISKLELERLNLLVDKVLRLSMFEQQALQLRPETLDLVGTTQQVIDAMTLQAKSVGASIQFVAECTPCWVTCDRLHLTGVVYNLLDNAIKYRQEMTMIEVVVGKTLRDGRDWAFVKVRDNGIGIAPEFQQKIFEKFFRVPVGNTHNVKGHGLGLSYVAHVAREHGGSIHVESQLGLGSTFTVEIPAAIPPPTV